MEKELAELRAIVRAQGRLLTSIAALHRTDSIEDMKLTESELGEFVEYDLRDLTPQQVHDHFRDLCRVADWRPWED